MTKDQFISLFFIALLIFVVWEIFQIFSPFLRAIFWSAILSFGFYPFYAKLKSKMRAHENLAAMLMTGVIFLLVIPPMIFLIVNAAAQAVDLYQSASAYIREGKLELLIEQIRSLAFIKNIEQHVFQWEPLKEKTTEWILTSSREIGNFTAAQVGTITKNLFFVALNIFFMFFLIFVFLKDGEKIYRFIYEIAPLEEKNKKNIFLKINE